MSFVTFWGEIKRRRKKSEISKSSVHAGQSFHLVHIEHRISQSSIASSLPSAPVANSNTFSSHTCEHMHRMPLHLPPPPLPWGISFVYPIRHPLLSVICCCWRLFAQLSHSNFILLTIRNLINYTMHICYTYIRLYLPALGQILYDKHKYVAQL